jgi:hypothetical protein
MCVVPKLVQMWIVFKNFFVWNIISQCVFLVTFGDLRLKNTHCFCFAIFFVCYLSFLLHLCVVFLLCFGLGFLLIYKWVIFWFGHDAPFRTILCFWFMLVCFLPFCSILKLDILWFEDTTWHTWHITPKAPSFNTIWWLLSPQHYSQCSWV